MKLRFTFRCSITIEGEDIDEIRRKWENVSLFSKEAEEEYGAEYVNLVSVEDEDFEEYTDEF